MTTAAPRDIILVADADNRRQRRARLADTDHRYGLDYIEVLAVAPTRWTLRLVFIPDTSESSLGQGVPPGLRPEQLSVCRPDDPDGAMLPEIRAVEHAASEGDTLTITVTLHRPPPLEVSRGQLLVSLEQVLEVDPLFAAAQFYLDNARGPAADADPTPATLSVPGATYAAKDFAGFLGLMMDRLRLTLPGWEERSPADVGVMLVELMAYAGDYLSYAQDAAATEAYLATARRRQSLRRHARLLDYNLDEGCSARVWIQIDLRSPAESWVLAGRTFRSASAAPPVVFESLHDARLFSDHNLLKLYAWGIDTFVVPAGATEVVLDGTHPGLAAGDVLMLLSYGDPRSSDPAAPPQVHAVRLVEAPVPDYDPVLQAPLTRIAWSPDDALPFPLFAGDRAGLRWSEARGNVVLAEHHTTFRTTEVSPGGSPGVFVVRLYGASSIGAVEGTSGSSGAVLVASAQPYDDAAARAQSAALALVQDPTLVRPCVRVLEARASFLAEWTPRRSFLTSSRFARDVVIDVDQPGEISLRFGDGQLGRPLAPHASLEVRFGVGGGPAGNIGPHTLEVMGPPAAGDDPGADLHVTNWLPAVGGAEPETPAQIRNNAPLAFQQQERCVAAADYAVVAARVSGVRAAAARFAWTGSFTTAVVHVLPESGDTLDAGLRESVRAYLFARRLAGTYVEVRPPRYVPVGVGLRIGVARGQDAGRIRRTLERELGTGSLDDGRKGFFHRDAFGFGQPVYLAPILARAASVPGVAFVAALRLLRWEDVASGAAAAGGSPVPPGAVIPIGDVEVARVRGDLERPETGLVELVMEGER